MNLYKFRNNNFLPLGDALPAQEKEKETGYNPTFIQYKLHMDQARITGRPWTLDML